ncbi:ankyrin repeat and socs box protein, putative [Pediculus humanus corporis]|uniref:Ankyrin repeat and socs box protein, putative n=1 Tax=Pediculus humanus subsp. corporis TaxID=121224 RepID=E0VNY8_PEDHC|nr:ankyrin repeat and socs box protein, putative [Pediculus humanus corporis]EEB15094.1 ankyrin repeat and socs box protein, putative [Pediculus humanus corporis]
MNECIFDLNYVDTVSPLSKAAVNGDVDSIKALLKSGKLPQTVDNRGWSAIHYCAAANQVDALKCLLKLNAKKKEYLVNLTTWENVTSLMLTLKTKSPSLEIIRTLLKAGADPNIYIKKFTPLHFAVTVSQDLETISYLVNICDLFLKNTFNRTAFSEACFSNFSQAVKIFLSTNKNIMKVNDEVPPLVYAAYNGNLEMVKLFLELGANVNTVCKAILPNVDDANEGIYLDLENYLPIHSALSNIDVFKVLLSLTDSTAIQNLNNNYCEFPLFILLFAQNVIFYEELLQSQFPTELKVISCRSLIQFILNCSWELPILLDKFKICFKYNFHLEPEDVFQSFFYLLSEEELKKNYLFVYQLATMGISSGDQFSNKLSVLSVLKNIKSNESTRTNDLADKTLALLEQNNNFTPLYKIFCKK